MNDIENPLEKLKVEQALRSEQMKLEYRQANKPNEVSILDVTVIEALKKQMPQIQVKKTLINNGHKYQQGYCPICSNEVSSNTKYCCDCGQKLRWE